MIRHPPTSPLFPYTTLFRSHQAARRARPPLGAGASDHRAGAHAVVRGRGQERSVARARRTAGKPHLRRPATGDRTRSEEHTSELQSRQYLVCRLLLEKKKKI